MLENQPSRRNELFPTVRTIAEMGEDDQAELNLLCSYAKLDL